MAIKKKFFQVEIPLTNSIAEILAYSIDELKNRTIKLDLTRQLRGKSVEVIFSIIVDGNKASAVPKKLTLLSFFIRRMMRKNISYIEDSFEIEVEDAVIRIKPFMITRKKVSRAVRTALRNLTKEWLKEELKNKEYSDIFSEIVANRLQKSLSLKLKKIYPLALCEIRVLEVSSLKEQEKLKVKTEKIKDKKAEKEKEEDASTE